MEVRVRDIMTRDPIRYRVPSNIQEVVSVLIRNNITGLPLVDQRGKYAGVISRRDIFEHPNESQTAMVMRRANTVLEDDSIETAARELFRQGRRHLTVTNRDNEVVGMLTPQNFMKIVVERFSGVKVKDVIRRTAFPIWENTPISVLPTIFRVSKTYACPVVDENGDFVSLITDRDIFDHVDLKSTRTPTESGIADDEDPWSWTGIRNVVTYVIERTHVSLPKIPAKEIMVKDPKVVYVNDSLSHAAKIMMEGNYNQLPVLESSERLAGMLYDIDIMGVFNDI
ncbi:CBS domain-containing protein [Thermogymnomonas acidicola]|uniref:CBS domain-containing protein n=1 Tax=Thermogymnomonas acidicola TaxID=399579 RepID=A0AA37BPR2_9ARCH|nr:CBS domain-containing protein [Thermogymnomonas acidicola]GGM66700.1 CBS domain-containing protein [Thermogymnomonas acidicola]